MIKHLYAAPVLLFIFFLFTGPALADNYPRNYNIDILHYKFELGLSDSTDQIKGIASITVLFKKNDLQGFRLDLANKTVARKNNGMEVESILQNGESIAYSHKNDALFIQLSTPSVVGAEMTFTIRYHGVPSDALRIGPTKYGDRSFFTENWPNRTRHWLPCIDHPYEKATCEFIIKAPSHYQVVSNGLLVEETDLNATTRLTHWKQSVPVSSWLYVLGVAHFAVQYVDEVFGKSIQTWVYPQDREAGFYDFAEPTKQTMEFFSEYIGPYVYEKVANIQSPSVGGGMETASAIFYSEKLINGKRDTRIRNIVIHELAHQWWGNAVTETTWDDAWLSEGFATFFTLLYIEHTYGHDEYIEGLLKSKKTVFAATAKDPNFSVIKDRTAEEEPVTSSITYQKGAWILHMLRDSIGHKNFQKGIQSYYRRFMNANATTDDFRDEMEKASGKDLKAFFSQWLYRPENPSIKGTWKYDTVKKQIIIKLEQVEKNGYLFDLPFELGLYKAGSLLPEINKLRLNTKQAEYSIQIDNKPESVVFDPRTVLLSEVEFVEGR